MSFTLTARPIAPQPSRANNGLLLRNFFLCVFLAAICATAPAGELTVAVASNFAATLKVLTPHYQQATGDTIHASIGSSGKLATQIIHGAPYDIFLSANGELPAMLVNKQLAVPDSRFTYATGTLALWKPRGHLSALLPQGFDFSMIELVALANPRHAPYGAAAQQVLISMGQWDRLSGQNRLALAESVSQAWHFAASGNVDVAFVALSQIKQVLPHNADSEPSLQSRKQSRKQSQNQSQNQSQKPPQEQVNDYWLPPAQWYSPIVQQGVILSHSNNQAAARRFCTWLQADPTALRIIQKAGYKIVDPLLGESSNDR